MSTSVFKIFLMFRFMLPMFLQLSQAKNLKVVSTLSMEWFVVQYFYIFLNLLGKIHWNVRGMGSQTNWLYCYWIYYFWWKRCIYACCNWAPDSISGWCWCAACWDCMKILHLLNVINKFLFRLAVVISLS